MTAVPALGKLALMALLLLGLAGCQTTSQVSAPLSAVTVPDEMAIATPAPLIAPAPIPLIVSPASPTQLATSPPPTVISRPAWPTNWVNAWIPVEGWRRYSGLDKPIQLASPLTTTYEFHTTNGVISIKMGNRVVHYNGLECWLGYAPQVVKGVPCIHWLDVQKSLQPLIGSPSYHFNKTERTIVIDPGHGGKDSGTKSVVTAAYEKDYSLDWALRLRSLLVTNGWKVLLTRATDQDIPLPERVAMAERANADLFLSLHFNSGLLQAGVETYCLTPVGLPSNLIRDYEDNVQHSFPNNAFDEQNFQLACRLHRFVVQALSTADRGVRRARFMGVLRGQNRPAVLIEAGYLSNRGEARKIASADYRQQLAEAVARALE